MRFLAVFLVGALLSFTAAAGEFRDLTNGDWFDEEYDGPCAARFDGIIRPGDEVPFGLVGNTHPLCLNSPGGSLSTALTLGTDAGWDGRILPGDTCESACAIAFLRAGGEVGSGYAAFHRGRALWAGGRLGLHSPGLNLPAGLQVNRDSVTQAFKLALEATAEVYRVQQSRDGDNKLLMNAYLYQRFLDTPPDDMYYIDTVGDALLADIEVLGVDAKLWTEDDLVHRICQNALMVTGRFESILTSKDRTSNRDMRELLEAFDTATRDMPSGAKRGVVYFTEDDNDLIGWSGPYPSGDWRNFMQCFVEFPERSIDSVRNFTGTSDLLVTLFYADPETNFRDAEVRRRFWQARSTGHQILLPALAGFAFDARLAHLPKDARFQKYFPDFQPSGPTHVPR